MCLRGAAMKVVQDGDDESLLAPQPEDAPSRGEAARWSGSRVEFVWATSRSRSIPRRPVWCRAWTDQETPTPKTLGSQRSSIAHDASWLMLAAAMSGPLHVLRSNRRSGHREAGWATAGALSHRAFARARTAAGSIFRLNLRTRAPIGRSPSEHPRSASTQMIRFSTLAFRSAANFFSRY